MSSQDDLQQAVELCQAGRPAEARPLLARLVRQEPDNENAWMWLSTCADTPQEKRHCLEQVVRINPNNVKARMALNSSEISAAAPQPSRPPQPQPVSQLYRSNPSRPPVSEKTIWQNLPPDVRASLVFAIAHFIFNIIHETTGGLAFVFTFPGVIMFTLFQGFFVARYIAEDDRYSSKDTAFLAARSGLWTWLLSISMSVIASAILLGVSLGAAVIVLPVVLLRSITALLIFVAGTILGAWLYGKFGGRQLALYTCLTGCGCSLLIGVILAGLIALLASFGYQTFQSVMGG